MAERPTVHHVGRAGDIPGGMTQVVNAYLDWPFAQSDMDVVVSRGDPGDHAATARLFLAARRRLTRIARSEPEAVVVVHLSERGSFLREGSLARHAARLGLPVVAHLHGSEFAPYERSHPDRVRSVLEACAHVVTLSDESSRIAARHVGDERVSLVPNAVPDGEAREKTRTIVFGGVVSQRKGIDVLMDAWGTIAPEFPDWTLAIAGPIRDAELVDPSLPRMDVLESISHDRLMALLDEAAVAVLPSRDEAMPMFILEALARRACVVSTTVGGIPSLIGDDHGILVPPGDASALASGLRDVLADDRRRSELAARGHARFLRDYAADSVYPALERIWLAPLGNRQTR